MSIPTMIFAILTSSLASSGVFRSLSLQDKDNMIVLHTLFSMTSKFQNIHVILVWIELDTR